MNCDGQSISTETRLRRLLDKDGARAPVTRSGKISRKHYAGLLKLTPSALTQYIELFSAYERRHATAIGPMRQFDEMGKWLSQEYKAGRLEMRDGKIGRLSFQRQFKLAGGSFIGRYPRIRALFEEFDARAAREGYRQVDRKHELECVVAALKPRPPLNKDRLTVNRQEVARRCQISKHRLLQNGFVDVIAEHEAQIRRDAEASKIDPLIFGRVYPFSDISQLWSVAFLEKVALRFKLFAYTLTPISIKHRYLELFRLLKWIGNSDNPHCLAVVAEAVGDSRPISQHHWDEALFAYRDFLVRAIGAAGVTETNVNTSIKALRSCLNHLASGNAIPESSVPLPGVKNARRKAGHLKSIAEADVTDRTGYVAFARNYVATAFRKTTSGVSGGEAELFLQGIERELNSASDGSLDPAEAIRTVLNRRLDFLREHALSIIRSAQDSMHQGHSLLARADIDSALFMRNYFGSELTRYARSQLIRSVLPIPKESTGVEAERSLANLLALIVERYGGIPPPAADRNPDGTGQFFAKRYLEHGGLEVIEPLLIPSSDAVGATLVLYLVESGANIAVGRALNRDCIEDSDLADHRRIFGSKARAKGKSIIFDLPTESPAVRAIEWLILAGERLERVATEDRDKLLLMHIVLIST